jgi:hypothetical protein
MVLSRELNNYPEGECKEMVELYVQQGIDLEDAWEIIARMSKYPAFFVAHMMVQELGTLPPRVCSSSALILQMALSLLGFILSASLLMAPLLLEGFLASSLILWSIISLFILESSVLGWMDSPNGILPYKKVRMIALSLLQDSTVCGLTWALSVVALRSFG